MVGGGAEDKATKKVLSAIESLVSKALYKGSTQHFFISGDLKVDTVELNAHIVQVVSKLNNISTNTVGEVQMDKLRNYFLIKAAIA